MDAYQAALHAAHLDACPDACPEAARTGSRGVGLEESRDAFCTADIDVDADADVDVAMSMQPCLVAACPPRTGPAFSTQIDLADVRRKLGPKYRIRIVHGLW